MVAVGEIAPNFQAYDDSGNPFELAQLRGRWVVLYFYPKDNTPGCTREACGFRDAWAGFQRLGVEVIGVSPDSVASHARFKQLYGLPFRLISDPGGAIAQQYGVWKERVLYGRRSMGVERTTVVIDPKGVVRAVFPKVQVDGHAEEVLRTVERLQQQ
jgi:peroxiredoxin Q/BCP